jgi:hypothetical protein
MFIDYALLHIILTIFDLLFIFKTISYNNNNENIVLSKPKYLYQIQSNTITQIGSIFFFVSKRNVGISYFLPYSISVSQPVFSVIFDWLGNIHIAYNIFKLYLYP